MVPLVIVIILVIGMGLPFIMVAYMFLAVIPIAAVAGLLGSLMSIIIKKILNWKERLKGSFKQASYVFASALVTCLIAYFVNDRILGSGKSEMSDLLFSLNKHTTWQIPVSRILGPILSFTTGASGGIFAPSLSAGATIGAFFAGLFNLSLSDTNLLMLTGMVAFLTGVTRSPFTSAILVLEMTDRHNVIFYLMLSGIISSIFANLVSKHSLYDYLKMQYIVRIHQEDRINQNV